MKYHIIQAFNMRQALIKIHEEFGADAMICRTRKSVGGIEVLVGVTSCDEQESLQTILQCNLNELSLKPTKQQPKRNYKLLMKLQRSLKKINSLFINVSKMQNPLANIGNSLTRFKMKLHNRFHERTINAFVGASGSGKTTTLIKIAVQYLLNHPANEIGVISNNIDDLYINTKLSHFCHLYQIDFIHVNSLSELNTTLDKMKDKKMVLIDTHGISHRDIPAIHHQRRIFEKSTHPIFTYMVIPASQQIDVIEDAIQFYSFKNREGCILTKADEALNIEPVMTVLNKCDLPLIYICNGEDLENDIYAVSDDDNVLDFSLERFSNLNIAAYNW